MGQNFSYGSLISPSLTIVSRNAQYKYVNRKTIENQHTIYVVNSSYYSKVYNMHPSELHLLGKIFHFKLITFLSLCTGQKIQDLSHITWEPPTTANAIKNLKVQMQISVQRCQRRNIRDIIWNKQIDGNFMSQCCDSRFKPFRVRDIAAILVYFIHKETTLDKPKLNWILPLNLHNIWSDMEI